MAAPTLPTLPACDKPTTVRLEVYRAANGTLYGSLEAVVYVCERHGIEAVSACQAAGLTAHRGDAPMPLDRPCGHVYAFPTASEQTHQAEPEHPAWCDRQDCQRRGEHRSPAAHVDTNRPEATTVDVALIQGLHPAAEPMVSLTSIEGPASEHVVMSIGQGRALTYVIRRLIDATKGNQR